MRHMILTSIVVVTAAVAAPMLGARQPAGLMTQTLSGSHRSEANRARDKYRHPAQTLNFFGVKPTDHVVELWPGGGWYTEILAPYMASRGKLTVAPPTGKRTDMIRSFLAAKPDVYGKVAVVTFPMTKEGGIALTPASADVVLTFRNVHNWRFGGTDAAQEAFNQIFTALKPGGVLGVVEHRLPETMASALEEKSGYMKRSSVVTYAQKAGFKFVGESMVNRNPKDTHDYPKGVWTLPPVYAEGDTDKAKYAAIGESDRMTLKFVKPRK
jgi:predicted methyltransferase